MIALGACGSDAPRTIAIAEVTDLGALPLPPTALGRDGGQSGIVGGQILWTFGDTFLSAPNSIDQSTVLSATAGWSAPAAPLALTQALDGDEPAQLIPYTAAEIAANQADSLNGYALWPGAVIDTGDGAGLVSFEHVARSNGSQVSVDGVGTARIAAGAAVATRAPDFLFAAPEPLFQPQLALAGEVYAWSCAPAGFLDQGCKLARASAASAEQRSAYEFFDGAAWTPQIANAAVVIDRAGNAPSISFNAHLGAYLAVTCEVVSSTILLRTAAAPEGPWSEATELAPSATGVLAPSDGSAYNYICLEHPELAAADGSAIVISYSRPTAAFRGEVRLARIGLD